MPRKKSIKLAAQHFKEGCAEILAFLQAVEPHVSDEYSSWCYEYAIIRLYREFEDLILEGLIGAINNDTTTISSTAGYEFPAHLTDEVCTYLVVGTGYFDFKGRDGLIRTMKKYVPDNHYLIKVVSNPNYKGALEKLSALRNFAAHNSNTSKKAALNAIDQDRVSSSGAWLKRQGRFAQIVDTLKKLADEFYTQAPY